jgi:hypothetical protein
MLQAGDLLGLQERVVAVGSLEALAAQLRQCKALLQALLPQGQHAALETFYARTVDATGECACSMRDSSLDIMPLSTNHCMHGAQAMSWTASCARRLA